jgi:hypothetical protein
MGGPMSVTQVLILDTRDGNLWRYWESPASATTPGSEGVKYIVQLRRGTKPDETIHSQKFQ